MKKSKLLLIGLITLFGFPLLGFIINYFFGQKSFIEILDLKNSINCKSFLGILHGTLFGIIAYWITNIRYIKNATRKYVEMIKNLEVTLLSSIFLSICAGIGEEIFFRGVLQNYFGVWITSFFFVAIHGYLNPKNIGLFVYGVFLTVYSLMLGYFLIEIGIWFSIYSHIFFDLILFVFVLKKHKKKLY